jgi:anti-anti-sigma factor
MALNITTTLTEQAAEITLSGELDASVADRFRAELDKVAASKPSHLVLQVRELVYIASVFLRMLLIAKQPRGKDLTIYVVAPQEAVLDTLRRTGLHTAVVIVDRYPPER